MMIKEERVREIRESLYDICCHSVSEEEISEQAEMYRDYLLSLSCCPEIMEAFERECDNFCIEIRA